MITTQSSKLRRRRSQGPGSILRLCDCADAVADFALSPRAKFHIECLKVSAELSEGPSRKLPCCFTTAKHIAHTQKTLAPHSIVFLTSINGCFEATFKALNQMCSQMSNNICYMLTSQYFQKAMQKNDLTAHVNASFSFSIPAFKNGAVNPMTIVRNRKMSFTE